MSDASELRMNAGTARLMGPPVVDRVHFEPSIDSYVVSFIPDDDVSPEPKEIVTIRRQTVDGRQVQAWLDEITRVLDMGQTPAYIIHSGGENFTFGFESGTTVALDEESLDNAVVQHIYDGLQFIAQAAQTVFRINELRHSRVAG